MKFFLTVLVMLAASSSMAATPRQPLESGTYTFQHKFSESPEMQSIVLIATIRGHRIKLVNETNSAVFPKGVVAEGKLMWHAASGQWIVGHARLDRRAKEVGGCSDGPEVVDLQMKIYWTC